MEMSEVLCLKWNNHKSIFLQNLSSLRTQELYSDATITCNGKYFSVHRLVLSTCSEYFEEIFERIRMQSIHPFIIVTNIESGYLEALLNFMYNGEVNVLHEMLPGLIKAAEILKIKGLAVPDEESIEKELIYAREREANNPNKDPLATHPKSPPRQSPIHRNAQPMNENMPSNCIIPDDMSLHSSIVASNIQTEVPPPIESNVPVYHTKDEVVEMCPMESPADYANGGREQHEIRMENENEIKLEHDMMVATSETLPLPPPPPPPPTHIQPPQQHYPLPPPAHIQTLPPPQEAELQMQETIQHYTPPPPNPPPPPPPPPPLHQGYVKEVIKCDYEMDHGNAKCSTWDGASNIKENDSNVAAAAVVQEVIQGLLHQSETEIPTANHENVDLASPSRHLRHTIKREEPTPLPEEAPRSKMKRRSSSASGPSSPTSKKCPHCSYVTKYISTLTRHIRFKHTGEKPHKCHFCPYRSAHNFNTKKHMMIHTGEKPFKCPLCSYKAAQNSNIKSHMKSHEKKLLKAAIKGTKKEKI